MNPIKVTKCPNGYAWQCTLDDHAGYVAYLTSRGAAWTLAQAADNGRTHCRRHHRQTAVIVGEHGPEIVKKEEAR